MSRPATAIRFGEGSTPGTWYDPPYWPDAAAAEQVFAPIAAWLHANYPSGRIGIAGTGFGWTQYFLFQNHGRQSWGFDVAWAITRAQVRLGAWSSFVAAYDVLNATQMGTNFRRMGNAGQRKYDVIFTEDLLPALSNDVEVATALANLRLAGTTLVHMITPASASTATSDMLWHTFPEWRVLVGPDRIVTPTLQDVA